MHCMHTNQYKLTHAHRTVNTERDSWGLTGSGSLSSAIGNGHTFLQLSRFKRVNTALFLRSKVKHKVWCPSTTFVAGQIPRQHPCCLCWGHSKLSYVLFPNGGVTSRALSDQERHFSESSCALNRIYLSPPLSSHNSALVVTLVLGSLGL